MLIGVFLHCATSNRGRCMLNAVRMSFHGVALGTLDASSVGA
jgi:hypothetical protein